MLLVGWGGKGVGGRGVICGLGLREVYEMALIAGVVTRITVRLMTVETVVLRSSAECFMSMARGPHLATYRRKKDNGG